ncbi:MAG: response regulator, partial [Chloroflexota bacterium]|nr:response regulator [Chloroflexota bacterium]
EAPPPVVMVTGLGDERVAVEAMKSGAYDYVVKGKGYLRRLPVVARRAVEAHQLAVERKRAEDALRESEGKYRLLADNTLDAIWRMDLDFEFTYISPAIVDTLGFTPEEWIGTRLSEHCSPEEMQKMASIVTHELENLETRTSVVFEASFYNKHGEEIACEVNGKILLDEIGKPIGLQGATRDITERKRVEKQLRQQERLAAMGQLAGGIAHDFNNMLTVIMLYTHQILSQEQLSARTVSAAEIIIKESKRASKLVGQILDFSRRSPLETSPMDLKTFIEEAVCVLERTIPENIHLHLDAGAKERAAPFTVEGDPTSIQQVLVNLVVNARDAMPHGGDLRIELAGIELRPGDVPPVIEMAPGAWIRLSVSDTGTGIPPHALDHIFEPFFTTKEPGKGAGLGLAQVDGIVAQHGGRIGVETEMGQGSTFRIYLPASGAQEQVVEDEASAPLQGQGETILLVEDNENLREGGRDLLELLGYRVLTGANGREALAVYEAEDGVDLVITDLVMPKMGGEQLLQELRKATPDLKVLALTGYAMEKSREELKEAGFLDVVYKPFEVDDLARVIRRVLDED